MPLLPDQVDDYVVALLPNFERRRWQDISLSQPDYIVSRIFSKKIERQGGLKCSWNLQISGQNRARNIGLFSRDNPGVDDLGGQASAPWTIQSTNWSYDVFEDVFQTDETSIVDVLKMREHAAENDMTELDEENFFASPTSSSDRRPYGLTYWCVKDTTSAGQFTDNLPSGHQSVAGVDPATVTGWRNWAAGYTDVSKPDLIKKMKKAFRHTKFRAPNPYAALTPENFQHECLTVEDVMDGLETLAENQNDKLGKDVAPFMNGVTVNRVPVNLAWWLDANETDDPIYGISWKALKPVQNRVGAMTRRKIKQAAHQHNVRERYLDNSMAYRCTDRRQLFVISK